jgi:hypothetical protein
MTADDVNDHPQPTAVASYATEGEADVAQAKLRAYGIEAVVDEQNEGGVIRTEGDGGVVVEVRPEDAADAAEILDEGASALPEE